MTTVLYMKTELDMLAIYQFLILIIFVLILVLSFWIVGAFLPNVKKSSRFFMFGAFLLTLISSQRDIGHLYWLPSAYNFIVPSILISYMYAVFHLSIRNNKKLRKLDLALLAGGIVASSLSNEFSGVVCSFIIGLVFVARRLVRPDQDQKTAHGILLALSLASFAILYFAPGNEVRQSFFPNHGDLLGSLLAAVPTMIEQTVEMIGSGSAVVGWMILLLLVAAEQPHRTEAIPRPSPERDWVLIALPAALALGVCYIGFVAGYYATGSNLARRGQNEIFFLGLVLLSFAAVEIASGRKWEWLNQLAGSVGPKRHTIITAACILILVNKGTLSAVGQLASGEASEFYSENRERYERLLEPGNGDVVIAAPSAKPSILYQSELALSPSADHWVNGCTAHFFGKTSIRLEQQAEAAPRSLPGR